LAVFGFEGCGHELGLKTAALALAVAPLALVLRVAAFALMAMLTSLFKTLP